MRCVRICALLFVTREALFIADEGQQQCEYEYHATVLDRIYKILQDETCKSCKHPVNPVNV